MKSNDPFSSAFPIKVVQRPTSEANFANMHTRYSDETVKYFIQQVGKYCT